MFLSDTLSWLRFAVAVIISLMLEFNDWVIWFSVCCSMFHVKHEYMPNLIDLDFNQVHMEVDRKAMVRDVNMLQGPHFQERITYKVGDKVIFGRFVFNQ